MPFLDVARPTPMALSREDLMMHWMRLGYARFVQPSSLPLATMTPALAVNAFGWLDVPTTVDHVIELEPVAAGRTVYWFSEKITTNSSAVVRMSLEGTFDGGVTWKTSTGYAVSAAKDHTWQSDIPIKTSANQGMRLRVFATPGSNADYYFKFIGVKLPWEE